PDALAHVTVRMSIGRFSTEAEVDQAAQRIGEAVSGLRRISPVWRELQMSRDINKVYGTTTPLEVA
ncbi:MAG: IscS subfamily cysteine desulfurase, partial [Gammaproteobacteria bacterium]|nr:IscS subfamily cysteine desulfurase [Gammaproteobacteria bacterium]